MSSNTQPEQPPKKPLTPKQAVFYGQLIINLPVPFIMVGIAMIGLRMAGGIGGLIGFLIGFIAAWLWWSFTVPLWRDWAKRRGADENETQRLAQSWGQPLRQAPLVWPKGHIFEKTEFRRHQKK